MYTYSAVVDIFTYVVLRCDHEKCFGIAFLTDTYIGIAH